MTRKVFEYFFDPAELEPYYSQFPAAARIESPPANPARTGSITPAPIHVEEKARKENRKQPYDDNNDTENERASTREPDTADPAPAVKENTVASSVVCQPSKETSRTDHPGRSRVRQLLSVHALGQYVYCIRSAILAAELGDEVDIDEPLPRLTYLPNFDRQRIEEMLSERIRGLGIALLYSTSMVILMVVGVLDQSRLIYPAMFAFLACIYWIADLAITVVRLVVRRRAAISASAQEVEPRISGIQPVNWWSMLKAGYEPVSYQRPFRHPELPLEGRPWRVLERGSRRIPVIRSGGKKLGSRSGTLYEKHEVRLAAYALLLEAMGHIEVAYGLVFPVDSPRGLAVPITERSRSEATRLLHDFSRDLEASEQQKWEPRLPKERSRCAGCKYGEPKPLAGAETDSSRLVVGVPLVLRKSDGREFHCQCGDRFGSAPPHSKSVKMGLSATLD